MKLLKRLLTIAKWLAFLAAAPFVGLFVFRSFLGVALVLSGAGGPDDWLGALLSLPILVIVAAVTGYKAIRLSRHVGE